MNCQYSQTLSNHLSHHRDPFEMAAEKRKTQGSANVKKKKRKGEALEVKRLCGYVAITPKNEDENRKQGWMYLRRHAETELFVGNLPRPSWFPRDYRREGGIDEKLQKSVRRIVQMIVPAAERVGEVFSTGNGRLATRVSMKEGEEGVRRVLDAPQDHVYMEYWSDLRDGGVKTKGEEESIVARWIREYEEERDEKKVLQWSNAAMKAYEDREKKLAAAKAKRTREGAVADEDGFVLVTDGGKQMKAAEAGVVGTKGRIGKGRYKSKSARNRKSLLDTSKGIEKSGFYRWQRESENELIDLQKKFRDDQKRISAIRGLEN